LPPQLALTLGLVFLGIIIYVEHQNSKKEVTGVVWIIALWILYTGSKGLGFFLNVNTTIEAGSPPDRYLLLSLGILSLIILINRHFSLSTALKQNTLVSGIVFYFLLSVLWSGAPEVSFRRWGREAIALIIALLLISEKNPVQTLSSALKKAVYVALSLSIILIKYFPAYGRSYGRWSGEVMWEGIASQKNGLAMICVISILFFIWSISQTIKDRKYFYSKLMLLVDSFMVLLALYLMMGPQKTLTYSATSLLSLIAGLISLAFFRVKSRFSKKIEKNILIIAVILIIIGITIPFSGKLPIKSLPKLLNRNETLTNRMAIWSSLLPYAKKHILLGYGFGGFWTTFLREQIGSHAHNGYLNTILDLGLTGLFLFIIFIIKLLNQSIKLLTSNSQAAVLFISLILMLLVRNIAEVSLGEFTSFFMWLLLAWSFILKTGENMSLHQEEVQQG